MVEFDLYAVPFFGGFMSNTQNSSSPRKRVALGLTPRDHSAIASAIAPLMLLLANVAAPRPAHAQTDKDRKADWFAFHASQTPTITQHKGNAAPVLRLAAPAPRDDARSRADVTPELLALVAALGRKQTPSARPLMHEPIVGIASTYNPCVPGADSGGFETASGQFYDTNDWSAAIQIELRARFGGVRYGRNYRRAYALIESDGKRVIVKINDVGSLAPGRVIDLNERAMRYFDPSLALGLLANARITPLEGDDWTPGPVPDGPTIDVRPADRKRPPRAQVAANLN